MQQLTCTETGSQRPHAGTSRALFKSFCLVFCRFVSCLPAIQSYCDRNVQASVSHLWDNVKLDGLVAVKHNVKHNVTIAPALTPRPQNNKHDIQEMGGDSLDYLNISSVNMLDFACVASSWCVNLSEHGEHFLSGLCKLDWAMWEAPRLHRIFFLSYFLFRLQ